MVIVSQWNSSSTTNIVNKVGYILEEGKGSCLVLCGDEEFVFEREIVPDGCYPRRGDWVTLKLLVEDEDEKITSVNYLREKTTRAAVEGYAGEN